MAVEIKEINEEEKTVNEETSTESTPTEDEGKLVKAVKENKKAIGIGAIAFGVGTVVGWGLRSIFGVELQDVADAVSDAIENVQPEEIIEVAAEA